MIRIVLGLSGAVLALLWLFVDARSDLKAERESCNVRVEKLAREATEAAGEAQIAALRRQVASLMTKATQEAQARESAERAAREALERPERVRTVIREVASANACIDTAVPDSILGSMRD